jgi:hypothetical protein
MITEDELELYIHFGRWPNGNYTKMELVIELRETRRQLQELRQKHERRAE